MIIRIVNMVNHLIKSKLTSSLPTKLLFDTKSFKPYASKSPIIHEIRVLPYRPMQILQKAFLHTDALMYAICTNPFPRKMQFKLPQFGSHRSASMNPVCTIRGGGSGPHWRVQKSHQVRGRATIRRTQAVENLFECRYSGADGCHYCFCFCCL